MPKDKGREWTHVAVIDKDEGSNPNAKVQCLYCDKQFFGGAARIRSHFWGENLSSKCKSVPDIVSQEFLSDDKERQERNIKKRKAEALDKATSSSSRPNAGESKAFIQQTIQSCVRKGSKLDADRAVARAFYANGIPFNILDNKYFKEAVTAIAACGPGLSNHI